MAKDKYHAHVRSALENDGWTITHDPYKVMIGRRRGYIDLGAELIAAEKNGILWRKAFKVGEFPWTEKLIDSLAICTA